MSKIKPAVYTTRLLKDFTGRPSNDNIVLDRLFESATLVYRDIIFQVIHHESIGNNHVYKEKTNNLWVNIPKGVIIDIVNATHFKNMKANPGLDKEKLTLLQNKYKDYLQIDPVSFDVARAGIIMPDFGETEKVKLKETSNVELTVDKRTGAVLEVQGTDILYYEEDLVPNQFFGLADYKKINGK